MSKTSFKTILSILFLIFSVIRLASHCSRTTQKENNTNTFDAIKENQLVYQELYQKKFEQLSNTFFYDHYQNIDEILPKSLASYSIVKLQKDTLVYLDLHTQFKFLKESYFQNNHDDTLHFAAKTNPRILLFIHDFESKSCVTDNFKQLKKRFDVKQLNIQNDLKSLQTIQYKLVQKTQNYNGFAVAFQQDNYQLFIEFESDSLSPSQIQKYAVNYLKNNLKTIN